MLGGTVLLSWYSEGGEKDQKFKVVLGYIASLSLVEVPHLETKQNMKQPSKGRHASPSPCLPIASLVSCLPPVTLPVPQPSASPGHEQRTSVFLPKDCYNSPSRLDPVLQEMCCCPLYRTQFAFCRPNITVACAMLDSAHIMSMYRVCV